MSKSRRFNVAGPVYQCYGGRLDWYLNHLRYADDVLLVADNHRNLQTMIEELNHASIRVGLKMNKPKTKVMTNAEERLDITIDNIQLDQVV